MAGQDKLAAPRISAIIACYKDAQAIPVMAERLTLCFRKIAGSWMVAHEHSSVPFYMDGSFRAAIDLKP